MSLWRQNYHEECEAGINKQINLELYASYVYLSMAYHFDRDDVALPGFHKFMLKQSDEEREHSCKLMKYQNERGGRIVLQDIKKPEKDKWGSGLEACQAALDLEKHVNQALLDLHKIADSNGDPQEQAILDYIVKSRMKGFELEPWFLSRFPARIFSLRDFFGQDFLASV